MKSKSIFLCIVLAAPFAIVTAQNPTLSRVTSAPETDETELFIQLFHQTLNKVVNDFPNDFSNIIIGPVSEEESDKFTVNAELPEAEEAYVSQNLDLDFSIKYVYVAKYFEGDEETAKLIFENVEYLIMGCPFTCCEIAYDNWEGGLGFDERSTVWVSVDENNPNFEKLLIQLRIYKSIDFTDDLETIYPWNVVLNVSRR